MNFGEAFGYWYLRLNGFFPLTNFVQHRFRGGVGQNADCDVLAVRLPHVYEMIGGEAEDWDNERFKAWGLDLKTNTIGVIGEIKTSEAYSYKNVNGAFKLDRLKYSIYRLGFFEKERVEEIARQLLDRPVITVDKFTVAKLFIFPAKAPPIPKEIKPAEWRPGPDKPEPDDPEIVPCLHLNLDEIEEFIRNRMRDYAEHKSGSRMFFPGDLIQYFAWRADTERKD